MKILKFGGASIKDVSGFKNLLEILKTTKNDEEIVIVVSAMGKTTRKLKQVADNYLKWDKQGYDRPYDPEADDGFSDWNDKVSWNSKDVVKNYHLQIISELFEENHIVFKEIDSYFEEIKDFLKHNKNKHDNLVYDQIMSFGELISSRVVYHYLKNNGFDIEWLDARELIKTNGNHGNAEVDIEKTKKKIHATIDKTKSYIIQGFIGSSERGITTTLGFEGSDYTATLIAGILKAQSVTIWKDVPGVFNADPRYFRNYLYGGEQITFEQTEEENKYKALQAYGPIFLIKPSLLAQISYYDAAKMAYFGASVIHPKTTFPLQKKGIPLYVKSFLNPQNPGTKIGYKEDEINDNPEYLYSRSPQTPLFMIKRDVIMLHVSKENASFIKNTDIANITAAFSNSNVKILMIQNLIDEFLICIESSDEFDNLKNVLEKTGLSVFDNIYFPHDCYTVLLTILYPNPKVIENIIKHVEQKNIVMQQSSKEMFQIAIKYDYT